MKAALKPYLIATIVALTLSLGFQNCAPPKHDSLGEDFASQAADPFAYPYKEKSAFYVDALLFASKSESESLSQFKVAVNIAYAEKVSTIDYEIRTVDEQNRVLCPTKSGSLLQRQSFVSFDCTVTLKNVPIKIIVMTSADGVDQTTDFHF